MAAMEALLFFSSADFSQTEVIGSCCVVGVGVNFWTFSTSSPKPLDGSTSFLVWRFMMMRWFRFVHLGPMALFTWPPGGAEVSVLGDLWQPFSPQ